MKHPHPDQHKYRENHFWQSYSDFMAALLFIFVLALISTVLRLDLQAKEAIDRANTAESEAAAAEATAESIAEALNEQGDVLENILGIRQSLIEALREQFDGDDLSVDSRTGAIIFNEDLLFAHKSSELKAENKQKIQSYIKQYVAILLSDEFRPHVAEIIIVGHSDPSGYYDENLWFSQQRAASVANFILSEEKPIFPKAQRDLLAELITVSGRSEMDPIRYPGTDKINFAASRRVEIQFRLKDEEMIQKMIDAIS